MEIGYLENVKLYSGCFYRPMWSKGVRLHKTYYKTYKKYKSFTEALFKVSNSKKFYIEIINPNASGMVPIDAFGLSKIDYALGMRGYAKKRIIYGGTINGVTNIYGETYELHFYNGNELCDSDVSIDYGYLYGNKDFKENDILIDMSGTRDKMIVRRNFSDKKYLNQIISSKTDLHFFFINPELDEYNPNTDEYNFDVTGIVPVTNLVKAEG